MAYTFDAGPNAFLLTLADDVPLVLSLLTECFGKSEGRNGECLNNQGDDPHIKKPCLDTRKQCLEVRGIPYTPMVASDNNVSYI